MHEYTNYKRSHIWWFSLDKTSLMKPSTKMKRLMNDPHTHGIETILRHVTKIFFSYTYLHFLSKLSLSLSPFIHSSLPHGWARKNTRIQSISIKICEWPIRVGRLFTEFDFTFFKMRSVMCSTSKSYTHVNIYVLRVHKVVNIVWKLLTDRWCQTFEMTLGSKLCV